MCVSRIRGYFCGSTCAGRETYVPKTRVGTVQPQTGANLNINDVNSVNSIAVRMPLWLPMSNFVHYIYVARLGDLSGFIVEYCQILNVFTVARVLYNEYIFCHHANKAGLQHKLHSSLALHYNCRIVASLFSMHVPCFLAACVVSENV